MEWPAALGIYGAIVATLTALWSFWIGVRDRGHLKLKLELKRYEQTSTGRVGRPVDQLEGIELHLAVVNRGRRPVMVVGWYGVLRGRRAEHTLLSQYPRQELLHETDPAFFVCRDVEVLGSGFHRMCVEDSSGRRWYVPRKDLRSIVKQIRALRKVEDASLAKP